MLACCAVNAGELPPGQLGPFPVPKGGEKFLLVGYQPPIGLRRNTVMYSITAKK